MNHEDSQRRVAVAAVYTKCRDAVISDSICINSGWRAVIEIKGADDHAIVSKRVCDGSTLCGQQAWQQICWTPTIRQAAGTAAAVAIQKQLTPRQIDTQLLRKRLLDQKVEL